MSLSRIERLISKVPWVHSERMTIPPERARLLLGKHWMGLPLELPETPVQAQRRETAYSKLHTKFKETVAMEESILDKPE